MDKILFNGWMRDLFIFLLTLFITFLIAGIANTALKKYFSKAAQRLKVEKTKYVVFTKLLVFLTYIVGIFLALMTIPKFKTLSVSLFAGAGILAAIIGFASQKAFSNIVSGIFIAIFEPFRVGDTVKVENNTGKIEDITLRHTIIRNFENKRLIIPNSVISEQTIENFNIGDEKTCRFVEFGISYDSNMDKAMKIMKEEAIKHPLFLDNRTEEEKQNNEPAVTVRVLGFGDSSVNLRAWVWAKNPTDAFKIGTDLNKSIKERFDKEGIEIPFPYRTIVYKKDLQNVKKRIR
ncbi:MAG: mechanosensitive ion channel family protein [Candidatus Woesearchaeota archaeon]